jgi:hypothetical protein|tara:strand:+ start:1015 stop:1491 length:477 start_codon:yes stop_codon:yes gene_type:complete
MSLQPKEYSHMRIATLKDVEYLAPRLRFVDKQEILAASGLTPFDALKKSFDSSQICFTIVNPKDEPVGIFGVADLGGVIGGIWMLGTDNLASIQIAFLKECKKVIQLLNKKYKILWNHVDCRNQLHIKWLKWCGFKFINKKNFGVLNKPFYEFIRICV